MNIVIVNHQHPSVPHVSGMRGWYFGKELAALGHRVLYVCLPAEGDVGLSDPVAIEGLIRNHDWKAPLLIEVRPSRDVLLAAARSTRTHRVTRKVLFGASYLFRAGVFTDFSLGIRGIASSIARHFRSDVVWGIFGNTDCWLGARAIAKEANAPWVGDVKDNWEVFIKAPLRQSLAARFSGMAAATANAEFHGDMYQKWSGVSGRVVYSGVANCFLSARAQVRDPGPFRMTVTGSIYSPIRLAELGAGLAKWAGRQPASHAPAVELTYAGPDSQIAREALGHLLPHIQVTVEQYLPLERLAELCCQADINAYVRNTNTFHHKLLELLACGKPVLPYPAEGAEAERLAVEVGGILVNATTPPEVASSLDALLQGRGNVGSGRRDISRFTWGAQARILEGIFENVVSRGHQ